MWPRPRRGWRRCRVLARGLPPVGSGRGEHRRWLNGVRPRARRELDLVDGDAEAKTESGFLLGPRACRLDRALLFPTRASIGSPRSFPWLLRPFRLCVNEPQSVRKRIQACPLLENGSMRQPRARTRFCRGARLILVLPAIEVLVGRIVGADRGGFQARVLGGRVCCRDRAPARAAARGDASACRRGVLGVGAAQPGLGGVGVEGHRDPRLGGVIVEWWPPTKPGIGHGE